MKVWRAWFALLVVISMAVFAAVEGRRQIDKLKLRSVATPAAAPSTPPSVATTVTTQPKASWFKDISEAVGLDFVQAVGPVGTHFMPEINGSGGAMFDFDNDGDLDLFLVNLGRSPKATRDFGPEVNISHRLYRHEADGQFSDQTEACGLKNTRLENITQLGIGCAVGDVNNDGFSDLYLTNYGPDQLFLNERGVRFIDVTQSAGLACSEWGTAAAFFDYDRDGWLDLVVINYCSDKQFEHSIGCGFFDGEISYCGPHKFQPTIDRLYHNEGAEALQSGVPQFTDVTESSGMASAVTYGLGVAICDFDGDSWPDIFVANDMRENRLWMNQRDGTFREEATARGVAVSGDGMMQGCMGVSAADIDHDADFDLVITNLVNEGSILYLNDGSGTFTDGSRAFDVAVGSKQHTGWGVALVDLDHDGDLDMPVANGFVVPGGSMFPPHGEDQFQQRVVEAKSTEAFFASYYDRNSLMLNNGKNRFMDATVDAGDFAKLEGSNRGLILGDIDNDGDVDLLTTSVAGRARLFRNDFRRAGHWLKITCWLPELNRLAIGAVIRIHAGTKSWTGQTMPSSSYLASNDPAVHFGLGDINVIDHIDIIWPDGFHERFTGIGVDQHKKVERGSGMPLPLSR